MENVTSASKLRTWAAIVFLTALVVVAFWRLTLMRGVMISDDHFTSDLMNENFPYRFSMGNALKAGQLPLWIRELYGGFPLLARAESGICYPPNIILFGLFSPYVALNLTTLLTLIAAGIGMYLYTREVGATYLASILAGTAFAFSGYLQSHLKHISMVNTASWLPIALLLLERAVRRSDGRLLLWFGIVFGLQHLAGNTQTVYYCGALYLTYFALRLFDSRTAVRNGQTRPKPPRVLIACMKDALAWTFLGMLVLGSLLAAVQLIPTYELLSHSQRSAGVTFQYASQFAYDPKDILTFLYPYVNGDFGNLTYTGKGIFCEDYGYVGLVTFLLALSAPALWWKNRHVRFFTLTAIISYVLVLGPATPAYEFVFKVVPGMSYFRFPTRLLLITDGSLVVLAALGLTRLMDYLPGPRARRSMVLQATLLAATVVDLLYFQLRQNPIVGLTEWMTPPKTVETIKQDTSLFRIVSLGGNQAHRRAFEQAQGWEGDLQPFVDQREFIQPSSNVLYALSSPNGYANLTPNYIVDVWGDQNRPGIITRTASTQDGVFRSTRAFRKLMRMYNVKYLTSYWPVAPVQNIRPLGVYSGAHLYQITDALPRAYLVGDFALASDGDTALRMLYSDDFEPERTVMLDAAPVDFRGDKDAGGHVQFVKYTTNVAEMNVQTDSAAILVFSDSYYPGWHADIDGIQTPIYRANMTQRAVMVSSGEHKVRFRFVPATVIVGFWISAASLSMFIVCLWISRVPGLGDHAGPASQDNPFPAPT